MFAHVLNHYNLHALYGYPCSRPFLLNVIYAYIECTPRVCTSVLFICHVAVYTSWCSVIKCPSTIYVRPSTIYDHDKQLSKVLSLYMKQSLNPSWIEVTTALWNIGEKRIAKVIADEYGMGVQ